MNVRFANKDLDRLETEPDFSMGLSSAIVSKYRQRLQSIRAATDSRDIRAMKSGRLEKLKGPRAHQSSLRLNDRMRLIIEFEGSGERTEVVIVGVEDYH